MSEEHDIEILAEEIRKIREELKSRPLLRQGKVTAASAGPPRTCTVELGEGAFPNVRVLDGYVPADEDATWVLILPGGVRFAIGDLP